MRDKEFEMLDTMIISNDKTDLKVHNLVYKPVQYCKHVNSQNASGGAISYRESICEI